MIIGIDGNEANTDSRVGVHIYALEILKALYKLEDIKKGKHEVKVYLKERPNEELPQETRYWKYKVLPGKGLWVIKTLMPRLLLAEKLDVFFSPSHYLPLLSKTPQIFMLHDLGYLSFSGQFKKYDYWQLKYWTAISIIISKYIICPSEATKKDIVRHYPFASKKIKVIPHGYNKDIFDKKISENFVRQILEKYGISKKFILFLSTLKPSKNIEGLIKAFKILDTDNYILVIAGKKGWMYEAIFEKVKEYGLQDKVVFTDYLPENEKPALFKGAEVFVLPSFWEGFGIDIIESYAVGTPVVVSDVASFPEVAGDLGIYVDPYKPESIASGLEKILKMNKIKYNELSKKAIKHAQKFSWEDSASKLLEILLKK